MGENPCYEVVNTANMTHMKPLVSSLLGVYNTYMYTYSLQTAADL